MPLDAVCLSALVGELGVALTGGRVDKVFMPAREEAILAMRGPGGPARLLLAAGARTPRAHITEVARENPAVPPMFCMLLRKHLTGARLAEVRQPPLERVLLFVFDAVDEMGEPCQKTLAAELMGRHSNLILIGSDGRIVDCLRRVDVEMSERRQVLPGLFYHLPPGQGKRDPLTTDEASWAALVSDRARERPFDDWLLQTFAGLPPLLCREIVHMAGGPAAGDDACLRAALAWRSEVLSRRFAPWLLMEEGGAVDFSYRPITQYGALYTARRAESFSQMLDIFYAARDARERMRAGAQEMTKLVTTLRDRARRKTAAQRLEWEKAQARERLREYGDLLMANLYRIEPGQRTVTATDFYGGGETEIPLNPQWTPQRNAAQYYKDYRRAKTAEAVLAEQIAAGERESEYLDSVLDALERASSRQDLQEIAEELTQGGYLRAAKSRARRARDTRPAASQPMRFVSSAHVTVLAGRNNRQNDALTAKAAARSDIWLHAQKIPGSHVVIRLDGARPDDVTLAEAAVIAATLSRAAGASKVPVDYTRVSRVKKPPGAKPGMVIYDDYKTLVVRPDKECLRRLSADGDR
ncbi:MAG: NFACT family protein [Oscillospiraceae bacterium]|jgi:predicted ribosome quality control (RQC) complex YloA/Tae2 family protein|nr:NFACT family protein [Oscillospiraceae bacterium]